LERRMHQREVSGSTQMEVPVKPVWPKDRGPKLPPSPADVYPLTLRAAAAAPSSSPSAAAAAAAAAAEQQQQQQQQQQNS
jgi:hypothetical protein